MNTSCARIRVKLSNAGRPKEVRPFDKQPYKLWKRMIQKFILIIVKTLISKILQVHFALPDVVTPTDIYNCARTVNNPDIQNCDKRKHTVKALKS